MESEGNRVYFLVKDPHWTFIWWEFNSSTVERVLRLANEAKEAPRFTIRIHDVTWPRVDGEAYSDIDVTGFTDHWYAYIPQSGRTYRAEIGFKSGPRFYSLGMSNPVRLPRESPSESAAQQWGSIRMSR